MSNIIPAKTNQQVMSSIELREIINAARADHGESEVENRHFLSRIEDELDGELGDRKTFTHPQNHKQIGYYDLTRDQCTLVGMRESKGVRRAVLEKLKSMESQQRIPQTLPEALRLAADLAEQVQEQQTLIQKQRPAVEFVGRYVEASTGSMTFREVAKTLGIKENTFRKFLADSRIMYKSAGGWLPYANHVDAGRFEVKTGTSNGHAFTHPRFTAKGVEWVSRLLEVA